MAIPTKLLIEFSWFKVREGYEILQPEPEGPHKPLAHGVSAPRIAPRGGRLQAYRPFEKYDTLYGMFAKVSNETELLDFVKKFGPLTLAGLKMPGDPIEPLLESADMMRKLLASTSERKASKKISSAIRGLKLAPLEASLRLDTETNRLRLSVQPNCLLDGLWLQLAIAISGGTQLKACRFCGEWFAVGPEAKRRSDAEFCSTKHKTMFLSRARSHPKHKRTKMLS